ncbi:MAG: DNA replication/repair protein RecF [Hydrogenibacillus schlegelii]|nr:DNA replication/repair protein RecF [Hydrogenibacillus schlegelii]
MIVRRLILRQFRNIRSADLAFGPGTVIFYGENGAGKTNLIEAIALLALGKSFRAARDAAWRMWGTRETLLRAEVETARGRETLELRLVGEEKTARADGLPVPRLADFVGRLGIVLFVPDDVELVGGPPAVRRRFFDLELSQRWPRYLYHLSRYHKILLQRNRLLKSNGDPATLGRLLEAYDPLLAESAAPIVRARARFVDHLRPHAEAAYRALAGGREALRLEYVSGSGLAGASLAGEEAALRAALLKRFEAGRATDVRRRQTLTGPHRDDLTIALDGHPAEGHASQGQRRSIALALKLAAARVAEAWTGEAPVVLLDDVLSELDERRQRAFLTLLGEQGQAFLTVADRRGLEALRPRAQLFSVTAGAVRPIPPGGAADGHGQEERG